MASILQWDNVASDAWTVKLEDRKCSYCAFKLTKVPNFSSHRFDFLCKDADLRESEVIKRQIAMIRQLHGIGENWGISLRLIAHNGVLSLYIVFRYALSHKQTKADFNNSVSVILSALPKDLYTFEQVGNEDLPSVLSAPWAKESTEITKVENTDYGDYYPNGERQSFYSTGLWNPTDNNMEQICTSMLLHRSDCAVDITIVPTHFLEDERDWINANLSNLRECMNGETLQDTNGKVVWRGEKLPILKTPIDNHERLVKQYGNSRVFISSIRVFTQNNAEALANSLLSGAVKNPGSIFTAGEGNRWFNYLLDCYTNVDISARLHSTYWDKNYEIAPFRAQRLSHLASVEEISGFFRIPIPTRPSFPGFKLDTGIQTSDTQKESTNEIEFGSYLDELGTSGSSVRMSVQNFSKHGLIVGVPGSGKTTAIFNILHQLWNKPVEERIPFIVLEPAKTEYRALKLLNVFSQDMLVFTLGDEGVSPFRFNPLEVLPGIKIESHISRLQSCIVGAFDLFDPLPIFLEQAIRKTYEEKGWYEDSVGGDYGLENPTLSDLCRNVETVIESSGFDSKMKGDFQASLLERLNSLRRGSKGRMLDTKNSIPIHELMESPIILELDALNGDEKSLMMMFLLSYVYEYCKIKRQSGSPLKHLLVVEEAHNLIPAQVSGNNRANPKAHTIELFVNMLAEMRALGQGILIADQLPTAIAPQAVKQTNIKILMRVTAKDDREEIGNTMDLNEEQMHQVINFKTGFAYFYHEGEDRVRMIRMQNFKGDFNVELPPTDTELQQIMNEYENSHKELFLPFKECTRICEQCNRRVRNQAELFIRNITNKDLYKMVFGTDERFKATVKTCALVYLLAKREKKRIEQRYGIVGDAFGGCAYIHFLNQEGITVSNCKSKTHGCSCTHTERERYMEIMESLKGGKV